MSTDHSAQLKPAFDAYVDTFNGQKDYATLHETLAPDFRRVAPDFHAHGPDEMSDGLRKIHEAYSDFHLSIDDVLFGADTAFCRWTTTGSFASDSGTNTMLSVSGATMLRFANGKITEEWVYCDTGSAAKDLGVASMPHTNAGRAVAV